MTSPSPATADTIRVSDHAAGQYRHRVKPGLQPDAARRELEQLAPLAQVSSSPPAWINAKDPAPYWLTIAEGIVLPLKPQHGRWILTTCVTKRTSTSARRDAKTRRRISLGSRGRARRRARF